MIQMPRFLPVWCIASALACLAPPLLAQGQPAPAATGPAGNAFTTGPAPVSDAAIRYLARPAAPGAGAQDGQIATPSADGAGPQPRLIIGNDQTIAPARPGPRPLRGNPAGLQFEDAPIAEVVRVVLGEIVKTDYVIYPPLPGTVTLSTSAPVPIDQAVLLLETALQANGIVLARDTRGVFHVGAPEAVRGIVPIPRRMGAGPLPPGHGTIIVPLEFIGAGEMAEILRPMAPGDAIMRVDTVRNLLILSGSRTQIEGWLDVVATFDVDLLKGMSVGIFPLRHVTVAEVQAAFALMGGGGGAGGSAPTAPSTLPGGARAAATAPAARSAASSAAQRAAAAAADAAAAASSALSSSHPLHGAVRILPIERLNSILVVTPRAAYLEQAREWIARLDQPSENDLEPQLFVYPVQNGSARHLADLLNGVFGGESAAGSSGSRTPTQTGVAPAFGSAAAASGGLGTTGQGSRAALAANLLGQAQQGGGARGTGVTAVDLSVGVRAIADELNNALLIYGPRREYRKIEATLRQLDIAPVQVLIEASIVEVTLRDDLRYGLQWYFQGGLGSGRTGVGQLTVGETSTIGAINPGFSYSIVNPAGNIRAVLSALASKSLLNVISTPTVMVQDNHTAAIQVGDQQPVQSSQTVTDGGNTTTAIQYKDTGVMLAVTPSVNAGGMVSMNVNQSITDVGPIDDATRQRSFLQRNISSRVAVRSGESVVLGGLIRDTSTRSRQGLPVLSDIPVLGSLFGTTNQDSNRTELLIVITPRVIRTEQDVRDIGRELRERMRSFDVLDSLRRTGHNLGRSPDAAPLPAPAAGND